MAGKIALPMYSKCNLVALSEEKCRGTQEQTSALCPIKAAEVFLDMAKANRDVQSGEAELHLTSWDLSSQMLSEMFSGNVQAFLRPTEAAHGLYKLQNTTTPRGV